MHYNLTFIKNIGRQLNAALFYLIIFSFILTIYEGEIISPQYLSGIPLILICYLFIECYCYQPVLYILLHSILFLPVCIMSFPGSCYQYLYLAVLIAENIRGILIWKRSTEKPYEEAPWALYLVVTILYILTLVYHLSFLSNLIYYCGISMVLIHFIRLSLEGIGNMLSRFQHATSVPTVKIILTSSVMSGFTYLSFFILAIALHSFSFDKYLYLIGDYIAKLVKVISRFLIYIIGILRALFSVESHIEENPTDEELKAALEAVKEPSLLAKILEGIVIAIALLFTLYLLYCLFVYVVKIFLKRYTRDSDQIISLHDTEEKVQEQKEKSIILQKLKQFFRTDNAAKIRRAYRLKIKSYNGKINKKSDTPKDIADNVLKMYDEDISELTDVYEKARYSNEEITLEDVKKGGIL